MPASDFVARRKTKIFSIFEKTLPRNSQEDHLKLDKTQRLKELRIRQKPNPRVLFLRLRAFVFFALNRSLFFRSYLRESTFFAVSANVTQTHPAIIKSIPTNNPMTHKPETGHSDQIKIPKANEMMPLKSTQPH